MEALPIYLDSIVPSAYAILISVIAVLFFGEVIPQAICTGPQQIKIGASLAPFIQFLKIALGIVSYPIAKLLD
jgi:metal transporter CNNM